MPLRRPLALIAAAAFAALAVLVARGAFAGVDQWATDHLMPGIDAAHSGTPSLLSALSPIGPQHDPLSLAADVWLYPASVPLSAVLVGLGGSALWRRGRRIEALLWPIAWVGANAVEVLTKHTLVRPAITAAAGGRRVHVVAFDGSLPSGHTLRSLLVVAVVAAAWPRLRGTAVAWAVVVAPLLVAAGWHVPTDVLAGALLAAVAVLAVRELSDRLERAPVDRRAYRPRTRDERKPAAVEPQP